jgi:hypothetical protein
MSVHLQLKEQITKFIEAEKKYRALDMNRERKIEAVINIARMGDTFSLVDVNNATEEINLISKSFGFPLRKLVTTEMVMKFVNK